MSRRPAVCVGGTGSGFKVIGDVGNYRYQAARGVSVPRPHELIVSSPADTAVAVKVEITVTAGEENDAARRALGADDQRPHVMPRSRRQIDHPFGGHPPHAMRRPLRHKQCGHGRPGQRSYAKDAHARKIPHGRTRFR